MASVKDGTRASRDSPRRASLVQAAIDTLRDHGYAGASARAIADRAEVNQALIFYHFGSVSGLLLAALDAVSEDRRVRYAAAVDAASSPSEIVEVASAIYQEDLDNGYVAVLVAMIAGAMTMPELAEEVSNRIGPWMEFARSAMDGVLTGSPFATLIPSEAVGFGIVALYLGMEMLTQLDGDRSPAMELFAHVSKVVSLLGGDADLANPRGGR